MYRILKPKGTLGLIWNARDFNNLAWMNEIENLVDSFLDDSNPQYKKMEWKKIFLQKNLLLLYQKNPGYNWKKKSSIF